ncbi:MFS transporter [Thermoflavimicrobium dichotomicum]|uniref:Predicted arabinose efflux permease, MFS family n=1 Tax=Thermoflavimicrobium dichotomicum TaxID=46223 RepID=A0A1I3N6U8_9BACL|nr:MFS transporter [Thermoflavimicrobium dichotomicum]SFJ04998.1 Predicted arabinose efflux permease, MFS family [Thermoflavimicrobium dichotomicum]
MASGKKVPIMTSTITIYLSVLDMVVLIPALNWIMQEFQLSIRWGVWAVALYLICFAVALPIMERWAHFAGRRYEIGFALLFFAIGSFLAGISTGWLMFLCGRGLQAFGASGMVPFIAQRVKRLFQSTSKKERLIIWLGSALLIFSPVFSTIWVEIVGWRSLFMLNLLLAFFLFFLLNKWLPVQNVGTRTGFSLGILVFGLMILLMMVAMTRILLPWEWRAWTHPTVLPLLIVSFGLIVILFMVERQKRYPFFEPHLFGKPYLWLLYLLVAMTGFSWAMLALLPWWFIHLFKQHSLLYGVILSLILVSSFFTLWLIQRYLSKKSFPVISGWGFFCSALAYLFLFWVEDIWVIVFLFILFGFGVGFTIHAPVHRTLFRLIEPERWRSGLIVLGMFRAAGGSLGLVVMAQLLNIWEPDLVYWYTPDAQGKIIDAAFDYMFTLAAESSMVGVFFSLLLHWKEKQKKSQ